MIFRPDCIAALGNAHIQTPNLDRLVASGLAFTHAYTMGSMISAVCTPSRTMILTGRSLFHAPSHDYALWPKAMAAGGYETFHLGKKGNSFVPGMEAFEKCLYSTDMGADKDHQTASQKTTDRLIESLRTRKTEKPFFIYYAPQAFSRILNLRTTTSGFTGRQQNTGDMRAGQGGLRYRRR